ncbi:hypothetical protein TNCV_1045761 [Trichonephila clavipes]|nr:hypothetical protein TNCV_1045761 [Trichonephila clavipes]
MAAVEFLHHENPLSWAGVKPATLVPTEDVTSWVFIESSALEQMVAIHSGTAAEWVGLVSSQAKSVENIFLSKRKNYWITESFAVDVCEQEGLTSVEENNSQTFPWNFEIGLQKQVASKLLDSLTRTFFRGDHEWPR